MPLDVEQLRARLLARPAQHLRLPGFRPSAVLVPLVERRGEPHVILTRRHDAMPTHAGQISFPGGKRQDDDADAEATALRETEEELGVARAQPQPLGRLDDLPTPTRFIITPIVAYVPPPLVLTPNPSEVAAVLEVPLSTLRDPATYAEGGRQSFLGVEYVMHEYHYASNRVWGATARIIHQLLELLPPA